MFRVNNNSTSIAHRSFESMMSMSSLILLGSMLAGCTDAAETREVFDSDVLHQVKITVDTARLNQLATDLDNRVPCTIVYDGETVNEAGIRQKGNTAIALDQKPSFSVSFDEFDSKSNLRGLHKILLNSSLQDPTFLREKLGADVHARAGLAAARIVHAHVTLNGADKGIYVVVEAIDQDFLQVHFGVGNDDGNLYEQQCCGDFATNPAGLELDREKKDGRSREDINALAQIVLNTPDAEFATDVAQRLNFDEFTKIYVLEVLLGHADGFAFRGNNYYMYDNPADSRFVFLPHGMDRILVDPDFDPLQAPVMKLPARIRAIPELDKQFQDQIALLGTSAWNETIMQATIDETLALLHNAKSGAQTARDIADLDANVTQLRNIITILSLNMKH